MEYIKTGYAEKNIEMVKGMDMTGFLARESCSAGIHDELKIKCIVFDDGDTEFVLIVCDLLGLDSQYTNECIGEVAEKLSVPADHIVIASIHTHSGPASILLQDCGEVDENWLKGLKTRIVECASMAADSLRPSKLVFKTVSCDIGINRVVRDENLKKSLVDKQVCILEIIDEGKGMVKNVLVNYACHPVTLTRTNLLYSADYPHFMEQEMQISKKYENSSIIFATGCCGDINPAEMGSFSISERLGQKLADSITNHAAVQIGEKEFSGSKLTVETLNVCIPLNTAIFEAEIERLKTEAADKEAKGKGQSESKADRAYKHWMDRISGMKRSGMYYSYVAADIKIVRIGKLTVVTLPFEVFHKIGLKIKEYFDPDRTMVLCYANGDYGYFPTKELYDVSCYEAGSAFKFYGHPGPVVKNAEDILLDAISHHKTNCN
ncbi:MAG: neutral/alkaline non-lysosomal ceramidase N-terminal domain-containing protein [Clostridiaceae bacterium]